ncbi:MAG TPA: hypothetical protein VME66_01965 [Candidatus Acidoferrales bacterium]|nr:hypothetical protein [Candidatus Acidoferrales bacterium]
MEVVSISERAKQALEVAHAIYEITVGDGERMARLSELAQGVSLLVDFIYEYTAVDDPLMTPTMRYLIGRFPTSLRIIQMQSGILRAGTTKAQQAR